MKIIGKVYEINDKGIKYIVRDERSKEKKSILKKNEVYKIVFNSGTELIFNLLDTTQKQNSYLLYEIEEEKSKIDTLKPGDYIKFNIQLGFMVNNNYSNAPRKKSEHFMTKQSGYSPHNGKKYNSSINIGVNFLFGKSQKIKHQIGIDYLRSYGEYEYFVNSIRYNEQMIYNAKIDFLNFTSGPSFLILKKLRFNPLLSINCIIYSDIKRTGYVSQENSISPYLPDDVTYYKEQKVKISSWPGAISFNPEIAYDFNIGQKTFGCYFSYNFSFNLRLPWYMAGITYYPFKKLR